MESHPTGPVKPEFMIKERIKEEISKLHSEGKGLFLTSSFQTQSLPLLHIISELDFTVPIYYLNTGYLFPETLSYIKHLQNTLHLDVHALSSNISKINQLDANGNLLFVSDPDYCCNINKVKPLESTIAEYDVWINGVRADQNANRAKLKVFEKSLNDKMRFHPMLDWTRKDVYAYINKHGLMKHPLEQEGYVSVGCEPCTRKFSFDDVERGGRWFGLAKSECGLHTELVKK